MVSLGRNSNMHNTGAQYMDENAAMDRGGVVVVGGGASVEDNQELLDTPVLTANAETFKPLKTVPLFSVHLLISTVISFVGVVLAFVLPPERRCDAYFVMMYLRAAFWVITYIFDHFVKHHHKKLRMAGYHDFHRSTEMQKGVPLHVVSLWNSMLLAVQALVHHCYGDEFWVHCMAGVLSPISYAAAFNVAETVVLIATHSCYIDKVRKFNRSAQPPDALRGTNSASGALGLMQPHGNTAELLEKQADLIAYLRDHNQQLNQKMHHMQFARHGNLSR